MEIYKYFGIISFATGWLGISVLLVKWGSDKSKSISRHAAAHKNPYLFMAISETISLSAFVIFTVKWLAPAYNLPALFSIFCVLIALGLLIAAWVPDVGGTKGRIHGAVAYGAAILFMPVTLMIAVSHSASGLVKLINYLATIAMFALMALFFTSEKVRQRHLYFQSLYILIFDIALIVSAFIK